MKLQRSGLVTGLTFAMAIAANMVAQAAYSVGTSPGISPNPCSTGQNYSIQDSCTWASGDTPIASGKVLLYTKEPVTKTYTLYKNITSSYYIGSMYASVIASGQAPPNNLYYVKFQFFDSSLNLLAESNYFLWTVTP